MTLNRGVIAPETEEEMFIGWAKAPAIDRRFLFVAMPLTLAGATGLGWMVASALGDPGAGRWEQGATHVVEGVLAAKPYPMIRVADATAPFGMRSVLIVAQGKCTGALKLADLDKLIDPHRNEKLYAAIRARLEAHGGKGDKAFPPDNPLKKPDRDGNPTGPVVRTVTMVIDKLSGIPVRGGIAKNDTMLRVDVFRHKKDGKFHLVPVYVHHAVTKELPNRAIVAFKDEEEWTLIDEQNFDFLFSAHPNDLMRVTLKQEALTGYFSGCDRSTGNVGLWAHDRNSSVGKDGFIRTGVKTAIAFEKFHVDVLGNIYLAPPEQRRGLA